MKFFKLSWKLLLITGMLLLATITMGLLTDWNHSPGWLRDFLNGQGRWIILALFIITSIYFTVHSMFILIKQFPKQSKVTSERAIFRIIQLVVGTTLGLALSQIIGENTYTKELVQGTFTASICVIALGGVLLTRANFKAKKGTIEEFIQTGYKGNLIGSIISGFIVLIMLLIWYAKGTSSYAEWGIFMFGIQLAPIITFLCFPKYYLP